MFSDSITIGCHLNEPGCVFGGDTSYACSLGTYFHRTRAVALAVFVVIVKAAGFYSPVIIIIDGCMRIMTSSFNRLATDSVWLPPIVLLTCDIDSGTLVILHRALAVSYKPPLANSCFASLFCPSSS